MDDVVLTVSDFIALTNQTLEFAYPTVVLEGEVSSFSVNQGKFVFFDLKDEGSTVGCFMMVFQLHIPLEDGMQIRIKASPKLTNKGRFSLTVKDVRPVGEGGLKRAYELLKAKLDKEGLFEPARKRLIEEYPTNIAVISSETSAGFADFKNVSQQRWSGLSLDLYHTQVQGDAAVEHIVKNIEHVNQSANDYDALVIIRGGGSLEDLQAFNTEPVVRAISASRVPTIVGVGHETDVTLAELAADVAAVTPTDAAMRLLPSMDEERRRLKIARSQLSQISISRDRINAAKERMTRSIDRLLSDMELQKSLVSSHKKALALTNPENILAKGYSVARHEGVVVKDSTAVKAGGQIVLQLHQGTLVTEVKDD